MNARPDSGAGFALLALGTRGGPDRAETWHYGAVAVVDGNGETLHALGCAKAEFPLRSCAKPFQLLPFLLDGLDAGLEPADVALMMSSHSGEPMHTQRVSALLAHFGLTPDLLLCGAHLPLDEAARTALIRADTPPTNLHSNCSGKHTGMLAVCRNRHWPLESYIEAGHPLQQRIGALIGALAGSEAPLPHSIDGCSLPTWWLPLEGLARLFSCLAWPPAARAFPEDGAQALLPRLFAAGTAHPELIAGTDRLDTRLMRALGSRVFSKGGAAGLQAIAVAPCERYPTGLGIALKVADGDGDGRVRALVTVELLRRLGVADDASLHGTLDEIACAPVFNVRHIEVGRYRPVFDLGAARA